MPSIPVSENLATLPPVVHHPKNDQEGNGNVQPEGDAEEGEREGGGFRAEEAVRRSSLVGKENRHGC